MSSTGSNSTGNNVTGTSGNDVISTGAGADTVYGGAGDDRLVTGGGNDIVDGGAGSDTIHAGGGDDTATWVFGENVGSTDYYDGGGNTDTLKLVFTAEELARPDVKADLARLAEFQKLNGSGHLFTFNSSGLTIRNWEHVEIITSTPSLPPLFTQASEMVNFNEVNAASYLAGSQYAALSGDDFVFLPDQDHMQSSGFQEGHLFDAGEGNDTVYGGWDASNRIEGGSGNDELYGGSRADHLSGGSGDDVLAGGGGDDILNGGEGDDRIYAGDGSSEGITSAHGGEGNDSIYAMGQGHVLYGDDGNDYLEGLYGNTLHGGEGDDELYGANGATLSGDAGDDSLAAWYGDNTLLGGEGNDTIWGGQNNDTIEGGTGSDLITDWMGNNIISGGEGNDVIHANGVVDGGTGEDAIDGTGELSGGEGNDTIVAHGSSMVLGEAGNDILIAGGNGSSTLDGGEGDDFLVGSNFYAVTDMIGGAGNDTLVGGSYSSSTHMTGGAGSDLFSFDLNPNEAGRAHSYHQWVEDFNLAEDTISFVGTAGEFGGVGVSSSDDGDVLFTFTTMINGSPWTSTIELNGVHNEGWTSMDQLMAAGFDIEQSDVSPTPYLIG